MLKKLFFCVLLLVSCLFLTTSAANPLSLRNLRHFYSYPSVVGSESLISLLPDLPYAKDHPNLARSLMITASYTDLRPADIRVQIYCEKDVFDMGEVLAVKKKVCKDLSKVFGYYSYKDSQKASISYKEGQDKTEWVICDFQVILYK